jgi:pyrimidine deaminase RibD-like protein
MIVDENNEIVAAMNTQSKGWEHAARVALEFVEGVNERVATA